MAVDVQAQRLLDLINSVGGPATSAGTPEQARAGYAMMLAQPVPADDGSGPIASVEDLTIPGPAGEIPLRVYRPRREGPVATVVFFHGGGWVIGSVATHDGQARLLCSGSGAVVVSVDYRLAPEHPFPAALEDCTTAVNWAAQHITELGGSADRLAVAGDSAGGNLAAAVALRARDSGLRLAGQLLVYPVTDASQSTTSYAQNAEGYFLTADTMRWFWENYLDGRAATHEASVLHATDHAGVAPAVVVTAEYDPLRDEGNAYAARLVGAGVPVTLIECPGLIHGFFGMTSYVDAAASAVDEFSSAFRKLLERL